MKKIIALTTTLALMATSLLAFSAPVRAQAPGSFTCVASSPYARGIWNHYNLDFACQRALEECAARTPFGTMCYIRRYWVN